ncbi:MAG: Mur ligase family protein [Clostridia bacterium]|nr:Mur ligase family protein [Clostridia bacterium]
MTAWMILSICSAAAAVIASMACARPFWHLLQLESYQLPGYRRALQRVGWKEWLPGALLAVANVALLFGLAWGALRTVSIWPVLAALAIVAPAAWVYKRLVKRPAKKELVFTPRLIRLIWATLLVCLLGGAAVCFAHPLLGMLWPLLTPVWVALAAWLVQPLEARVNKWFFQDAQRILRGRPELIRIGITGSYGKTSTKFVLATLLAERYNVLTTPGSFNTPMGLTRVIRERLLPGHQVFIAEMGARHVGDIRELCELVNPVIGLLTSVGPQHLETMGTIERITETKYELIQSLPRDGAAFFGRGNEICERLYHRCPLKEKRLAGERLRAEDVEVGPFGSRFLLVDEKGQRVRCETKLLGVHNIDNLLLCAEVAQHLGLTLDEMSAGINKL